MSHCCNCNSTYFDYNRVSFQDNGVWKVWCGRCPKKCKVSCGQCLPDQRHYCRVCRDPDSDHRSSNCGSSCQPIAQIRFMPPNTQMILDHMNSRHQPIAQIRIVQPNLQMNNVNRHQQNVLRPGLLMVRQANGNIRPLSVEEQFLSRGWN